MTLKLFNVGSRALDHLDLYSAARPVAEELSEDLGETVHMGVLEGDSAVYVLKIESRYTIRMFSRVGRRIPLYCTAIGKVLLAFAKEEERESGPEGGPPCWPSPRRPSPPGPRSTRNWSGSGSRASPWTTRSTRRASTASARPSSTTPASIVATISVSWPSFRYERGEESEKVDKVKAAAARISTFLGYRDGIGD